MDLTLLSALSFMSYLGFAEVAKSFDTSIRTPTSLFGGPVTTVGGQNTLKPCIFAVAACPCVVSTSDKIATEVLYLHNKLCNTIMQRALAAG